MKERKGEREKENQVLKAKVIFKKKSFLFIRRKEEDIFGKKEKTREWSLSERMIKNEMKKKE